MRISSINQSPPVMIAAVFVSSRRLVLTLWTRLRCWIVAMVKDCERERCKVCEPKGCGLMRNGSDVGDGRVDRV
jgi:hypothetical protein